VVSFVQFTAPKSCSTCISPLPIRATCAIHLIRLDFIILLSLVRSRIYEARDYAIFSGLLSLPPSYAHTNIPLSTPFSNTLRLCTSLNVTDQVSHPYKTTGKLQFWTYLDLYAVRQHTIGQKVPRPGCLRTKHASPIATPH
jgi:hypothetical protein